MHFRQITGSLFQCRDKKIFKNNKTVVIKFVIIIIYCDESWEKPLAQEFGAFNKTRLLEKLHCDRWTWLLMILKMEAVFVSSKVLGGVFSRVLWQFGIRLDWIWSDLSTCNGTRLYTLHFGSYQIAFGRMALIRSLCVTSSAFFGLNPPVSLLFPEFPAARITKFGFYMRGLSYTHTRIYPFLGQNGREGQVSLVWWIHQLRPVMYRSFARLSFTTSRLRYRQQIFERPTLRDRSNLFLQESAAVNCFVL